MASFNLHLNPRPSSDGLHVIYIRVTDNRKHKYIKTDIRVKEADYNKKAKFGKWIRSSNPANVKLNAQIEDELGIIKEKYKEIVSNGGNGLEVIKHALTTNPEDGTLTMREYVDVVTEKAYAEYAYGFAKLLDSVINRFVAFVGEKTLITEVTRKHVQDYRFRLIEKKLLGSTINLNLRKINSYVFERALNDGLIDKNPFQNWQRVKEAPVSRLKLKDDKIEQLKKMDFPTDGKVNWKWHTRNMYLLSYYNAGIRIKDMLQLRWCNIENGRLEYEMDKTGHKKSILLSRVSLEIIELYVKSNSNATDYIFPFLNPSADYAQAVTYEEKLKSSLVDKKHLFNAISSKSFQVNKTLNSISESLGVKKRLSFHTARHSFADKARRMMKAENSKVTMYDIKNSLGHKSIVTTEKYMESFDVESLDEAMNDIFGE